MFIFEPFQSVARKIARQKLFKNHWIFWKEIHMSIASMMLYDSMSSLSDNFHYKTKSGLVVKFVIPHQFCCVAASFTLFAVFCNFHIWTEAVMYMYVWVVLHKDPGSSSRSITYSICLIHWLSGNWIKITLNDYIITFKTDYYNSYNLGGSNIKLSSDQKLMYRWKVLPRRSLEYLHGYWVCCR